MVMAVMGMRQHLEGRVRERSVRVKVVFWMQPIRILHARLECRDASCYDAPSPSAISLHVVKSDSALRADSPWSLYGWVKPAEEPKIPTLVAGFGDPEEEFSNQ